MLRVASDAAANPVVWPGWRGPLTDLPYLAIDLETTGLDPQTDRIIEIAAHGPRGPEFASLVDPGEGIEITGPHGLAARDLAGAPAFATIASRIQGLLSGRLLVGHNARFDLAFLRREFERLGRPLSAIPFVCTIGLAETLGLDHESRSLAHACHRHGIALVIAHRAGGDALAAAKLFELYSAHADSFGLDLGALAHFENSTAGIESWGHPPLEPPAASSSGQLRAA